MKKNYEIYIGPFSDKKHGKVPGFILGDDLYPDRYTIVIDSRLPIEQQKHVLKHEFAHMLLGHVEQFWRGDEVEQEAEEMAYRMTDDEMNDLIRHATKIERM